MDSGNSGSMQSSSGGEDEYDSRSESISSFLNSSAHFGSISDTQQPAAPPQLLSHAPPTLFNHQNLDAFQQTLGNPSGNNTNQFGNRHQNDQLLWSRGLRSDPGNNNYPNNFGNISSVSSSSQQTVLNVQAGLHQSQPAIDANNAANKASSAAGGIQPDHHHQPNTAKNPKKRTRASRRAPTTVLTTDTTNFRQMVQEFTGIPTAPFSAGSPYSRRLDLFSGAGTGLQSNIRSAAGHLDSLGPLYPLRPSAQKVHHNQISPTPSLLNSSSIMIDSLVSSSTNSGMALNMQNQMLSFQGNNNNNNNSSNSSAAIPSFLQHPSLKQQQPSSMLTGKSQGISSNNNTSGVVPSFDELGLGRHDQNVNVNASLDNSSTGLFQNSSAMGNYSSKFNCSASTTSEFLHHHDKGLENVTSGGEGTVGSWICPSD
ncbi:OLC1v1017439C1 [Oldenlandia corymbosa var. corymbosa]|uniref:OLC1v1017439C1 n=1 Tax=Oldenlandia corymbosa var. corymbosa TaxID=529605 RepID=A0AAV1E9G9_OLDCO|nr:OLC1v1017439C1 [Oldenlandia corymbosa var. corymbosa]